MKQLWLNSNQQQSEKIVFVLSTITLCYFLLMIISYKMKYDSTMLGFMRELLTIPFILGLVVLYILAVKGAIKNRFRFSSLHFISLIILSATAILIIAAS